MRYLAIDYGSKRTGLAVCDATETIVSPLAVLGSGRGLLTQISEIVRKEGIDAVVVGLPLNMDDTEGPQAKAVLSFVAGLKKTIDLPVYLQDERLSSFAAEQKLNDAGIKGNGKKHRLDALAAAEILQTFLEEHIHEK